MRFSSDILEEYDESSATKRNLIANAAQVPDDNVMAIAACRSLEGTSMRQVWRLRPYMHLLMRRPDQRRHRWLVS